MKQSAKKHRLSGLDLTRFIAMLMMIQGHTIYALISPENVDYNTWTWFLWDAARGFTAPVFLFVSGASHIFANKRDEFGQLPASTLKRRIRSSLILLFIAYVLAFPCSQVYDIFHLSDEGWCSFLKVNILHLFAVSLIAFNLIFYFTKSNMQFLKISLLLGVLLLLLSPLAQSIDWFAYFPHAIAAYFSKDQKSIFTILPFSAYLFFGGAFGAWIKEQKESIDKNQFVIQKSLMISIPILLITVLMMNFVSLPDFEYFMMKKADIVRRVFWLGVVFFQVALFTYIASKTPKLHNLYSIFAKKALFIYVAHLMIIYGTAIHATLNAYYAKSLQTIDAILMAAFVMGLTLLITYIYSISSEKFYRSKYVYRLIAISYISYIIFV